MQKSFAFAVEKQLALLFAAIYALGVIIVNFHMAEYKVAGQLGWLRPIYLFAGVYGLVPVAVGFAFCCLVAGAVKKGHLWVKAAAVSVLLLAMWLLAKAGLDSFDFYIAKDFALKWDKWMWIDLGLAVLLGAVAYLFLLGRWKPGEKTNFQALYLWALPAIFVWLVYGYTFSIRFYNRIPPSWGGARSFSVEFILDPNDLALRAEMERAGVRFYPGTTRTRDTKLIVQTENDFICSSRQISAGQTVGNPFLLKRETIKAIKFGSYGY